VAHRTQQEKEEIMTVKQLKEMLEEIPDQEAELRLVYREFPELRNAGRLSVEKAFEIYFEAGTTKIPLN
jgi:hypothetical protein